MGCTAKIEKHNSNRDKDNTDPGNWVVVLVHRWDWIGMRHLDLLQVPKVSLYLTQSWAASHHVRLVFDLVEQEWILIKLKSVLHRESRERGMRHGENSSAGFINSQTPPSLQEKLLKLAFG